MFAASIHTNRGKSSTTLFCTDKRQRLYGGRTGNRLQPSTPCVWIDTPTGALLFVTILINMSNSKNETAGETAIQVFNSDKFGVIRTAGTEETPLFCLADVCKALGLQAAAVSRRLTDDVISSHTVSDSKGRKNRLNFVNEDGLYDVILDSRKPEARAFRKWVTSEVLPSIRRSGGYMVARQDETAEETLARALKIADETMKRQQRQLESAGTLIEVQASRIRSLARYEQYSRRVRETQQTYTMTQVSEFLGFDCVSDFMDWCIDGGILHRCNGMWMPTDGFAGRGYFSTRVFRRMVSPMEYEEKPYTVVTESGRMMLYDMANPVDTYVSEEGGAL